MRLFEVFPLLALVLFYSWSSCNPLGWLVSSFSMPAWLIHRQSTCIDSKLRCLKLLVQLHFLAIVTAQKINFYLELFYCQSLFANLSLPIIEILDLLKCLISTQMRIFGPSLAVVLDPSCLSCVSLNLVNKVKRRDILMYSVVFLLLVAGITLPLPFLAIPWNGRG